MVVVVMVARSGGVFLRRGFFVWSWGVVVAVLVAVELAMSAGGVMGSVLVAVTGAVLVAVDGVEVASVDVAAALFALPVLLVEGLANDCKRLFQDVPSAAGIA